VGFTLEVCGGDAFSSVTDQEINEAVALKLGGERRTLPDAELEDGTIIRHFPDFCHSIAAAWEIIEKVKWYTMWHDDQGFHFWIRANEKPEPELAAAYANTAPMAICLAFLKLEEKSNG
jgi:hypothetical protein